MKFAILSTSLKRQLELDRSPDSWAETLFRFVLYALFGGGSFACGLPVAVLAMGYLMTWAGPDSALSEILVATFGFCGLYLLSYFVWRFSKRKSLQIAWWSSVGLVVLVLTVAAVMGL